MKPKPKCNMPKGKGSRSLPKYDANLENGGLALQKDYDWSPNLNHDACLKETKKGSISLPR